MYQYRCCIDRVVDGDTLYVYLDLGFHCFHRESLRLYGINTPELFSGTDREAGARARDFTLQWVATADADAVAKHVDWPYWVQTYKGETFGRYLGDIRRWDGPSLSDALVDAGHAVRVGG